jgi:hypothetical protein
MGLGEIGEWWSHSVRDEQQAYAIGHYNWIGKRSAVIQKTKKGRRSQDPIFGSSQSRPDLQTMSLAGDLCHCAATWALRDASLPD